MSVLLLKQLEKRIGNTTIFSPFDLEIKEGESAAIQCNVQVSQLLIQMLIGETPASGGQIYISGSEFTSYKRICKQIGILSLNEGLYERLTPFEYLTLYKRLFDVNVDVNELLQSIGLTKKIRINKLSFSEKKRLQIGRAILHNPALVILEEPIQNVDIESIFIIQNIISTLTKQGKALLITTSNLENAIMMSSNVYRLNADGLKKIDIVEDEDNQEEKHEETIKEEKALNEENEEDLSLNLAQFRFEKIPVKVDDKIILLDPTEIDFIESSEGVSNVHVKGEIFPCSYTLNQLFDRLYPFGFFRSHRSYIVNLQKVREVITWTRNSYSLILDDSKKSSVPLSKGKLNELKEIIRI